VVAFNPPDPFLSLTAGRVAHPAPRPGRAALVHASVARRAGCG
jgi:hypothetical protein